MHDYDADGKKDIFTYSKGYAGIKVFRNTSGKKLDFEPVVYPYLKSFQGGGYVNILVTDVDYPGIADIDGDGDSDLLTFWGLGSFVEMHKNMSMEKYGIPDSLDFVKTTNCWGYFAESEESNELFLDTCFNWPQCNVSGNNSRGMKNEPDRHTGSTFTMIDINNNGVMDLVLGDVDYPTLVQFTNGGTPDSAYMTAQTTDFPAGTKPVHIFSFPLASYLDVDNNGINDLVVAPFDPGLYNLESDKSAWLYLNYGSNSQPSFQYMKDNFIQDDMLDFGSGAYPVLADFNADGLQDLIVSNYGYYDSSWYLPGMFLKSKYSSAMAFFRNTGTPVSPEFTLVTGDLGGIRSLGWTSVYPAVSDLDGDGDLDIILGNEEGEFYYCMNIAGPAADPGFDEPAFLAISGPGSFLSPQLFDLDKDGLPDLITGEKGGNLNYYRNTGAPGSPEFSFITDSLGKVNVTDPNFSNFGYSVPCFFINREGVTELIVGSEQGKLFYYRNIENNLTGAFEESELLYLQMGEEPVDLAPGVRSGCAIHDLNGDGYLDLIAGNFSGGLNFYSGVAQPNVFGEREHQGKTPAVKLYPNPARSKVAVETGDANTHLDALLQVTGIQDGKILKEVSFSGNKTSLDIHNLKPGIYLVRVSYPANPSAGVAFSKLVLY
ncbi:MAG: T9SS type A sorting domain-containing protein [Bacteroidales bacterium]|nr:T9SS type A sorting domain-containing protein [Bacteroidales bacterium]